jgi:hypothetical protein
MFGADGLDRLEAADHRDLQVHQRHIGPVQPVQLDRLRASCRCPHHLHVGLPADQRGDPFAHHAMVVDAEDPDPRLTAPVLLVGHAPLLRSARLQSGFTHLVEGRRTPDL